MNIAEESLTKTYSTRYGTPHTDTEAIEILINAFSDLVGNGAIEESTKDGIGEYYRTIGNRGLPAFEWLLEAFHVTSKKEDSKRNFRYIVGMLRIWMKHGFGHIPSQEEEDVVQFFEEVTGTEVTPKARALIQRLMGTYGSIKVTIMIAALSDEIPFLLAQLLKEQMDLRYLRNEEGGGKRANIVVDPTITK